MSILTKSHASGSCQQCFRCIHEALPHLPPASALCDVHKLSSTATLPETTLVVCHCLEAASVIHPQILFSAAMAWAVLASFSYSKTPC